MPIERCPTPAVLTEADAVELLDVLDALLDLTAVVERIADRLGCLDEESSTSPA